MVSTFLKSGAKFTKYLTHTINKFAKYSNHNGLKNTAV
jgi:hypothetical protein